MTVLIIHRNAVQANMARRSEQRVEGAEKVWHFHDGEDVYHLSGLQYGVVVGMENLSNPKDLPYILSHLRQIPA